VARDLANPTREALVITAAEAVHGQREDLSSRQVDFAARAYALPQHHIDG